MPRNLEGDFSALPEEIRKAFPLIAGEIIGLRDDWTVFEHLFMTDRAMTEEFSGRLGPLLGKFQTMLQDELLIGIARLIDPASNRSQDNLCLDCLIKASSGRSPKFKQAVIDGIAEIKNDASEIKFHRNKRIAHFDLNASQNTALLPTVTFMKIRSVIERMESLLNLIER
jgi:hypothetical protein